MNEMYVEAGVKCEFSQKDIVKVTAFFAGFILSVLLSFFVSMLLLVIPIGLATYGIMKAGKLSYEYEYIFCDGQLDFDKITGNIKRKRMMRIDFEKCEVIAPQGSHQLDGWNNKNLKVYNFTSNKKDIHPYVVVVHKDTDIVKVLFEPSQEMIECMRNKSRRLVYVD